MSTNRWRHSICQACWNERNPGREPVAVREEFRDEKPEACCFCGRMHGSGIYVREDPGGVRCGGASGVHAEVAA
jgi:hypothetical protein